MYNKSSKYGDIKTILSIYKRMSIFLPSVPSRYMSISPKGRFKLLKYKSKRKMARPYPVLFPSENYTHSIDPTLILIVLGTDST